jgi:hypothetical protein
MNKYKCIQADHGYDHVLVEGQIYQGKEEPGHFTNWPYLVVFDDHGEQLTTAYLSRFEKVNNV